MKTVIAVPMRDLPSAKSRLAQELGAVQTKRVAFDLFDLGQRFFSTEFPEIDRVVVTPCRQITRVALGYGSEVVREPDTARRNRDGETGLDAAAMLALNRARKGGYEWLVILPGDLPHLLKHEFRELLAQRNERRATIVPSHDGGTNALLLPVRDIPHEWTFAYGLGSAERHAGLLEQAGIGVKRLELPALSQDVDTTDDYMLIASWWAANGERIPLLNAASAAAAFARMKSRADAHIKRGVLRVGARHA
ncbi:hypothetical protein E2553_33325 [Paraburkholderia dipogonis]|uniref:2-phospho-L-lactate guanylyltransferase n=1 Tax=Paraburkholderia dipogonis TaxID=1211383 RepID=A0A4Y8MVW3_9BURK|nr:NTP transferase domain-containing protein [Paraburkholderia dipogonis]TFE41544.1 hypothetical protein E2553_33325 [Paraburkholderia dipogonis]